MGLPREPSEHSDASDEVRSHSRMDEKKASTLEDIDRDAVSAKHGDAERHSGTSGSGWDPTLADEAGGGVLDENDNVDVTRKVEKLELGDLNEDDEEKKDERKKDHKKKGPAAEEGSANSKNITDRNGVIDMTPKSAADSMDTGEEREGGEGEEEEEEEEEDLEMTLEERKEMRDAVVSGDIDLFEDLLEKPNADIRMVYFEENLLMAALRVGQLEMAEFLLDNGVDHNFTAIFVEPGSVQGNGKGKKAMELYEYSCRQMAYDKDFMDIVGIIDSLNGRLFPGVKLRERVPRFRRPPPPPASSSSSCGDSTSGSDDTSSGEESDVSGEAGPDDLFTKSRRRTVDVGVDRETESTQRARGSVDIADGEDQHDRRKKKAKKKRKKKKKEKDKQTDEDAQDGEKRSRRRSSEAFLSEGDTGAEEPSAKNRARKVSGRHLSTDLGSEGGLQESAASSSRRSGGRNGGRGGGGGGEGREGKTGDDHGEQLTDRSRSTAKSSETRTADTSTVVNDEGYETMSPSPTHFPPQQQQQPRFQPPSIPVKPTKAFLALRRTQEIHRQRCIPARYNEARPLHWTKIRTPGSYEVESPLWHQPLPSPSPSSLSSSTKLPPPTPAGTATTPSMLSPRSRIEPRTSSQASNPTTSVSTVELPGGDVVTKPKILTPTQRLSVSASSQPKSSNVVGLNSADTKSSASIASTTTSKGLAAVGANASAANSDKMYPLKHRVPSYMRMTTSCFVKRRLEPNFTNSYSALDFVEPSPRAPAATAAAAETALSYNAGAVKGNGGDVTLIVPTSGTKPPASLESGALAKKISHSSRVGDEGPAGNKTLVARKPTTFLLSPAGSGRTSNGFPAVNDVSSSPSPLISRRKPLVVAAPWVGDQSAGCGGDMVVIRRPPRDGVPNIRNNSSVFQPPAKVTTVPRKVR